MAKGTSRIGVIDREFKEKVMPIFQSWGLERHPNSMAEFGRFQYGYEYDFAEAQDRSNIKLCSFYIFTSDGSLAIDALKDVMVGAETQVVPLILNVRRKTFRLARPLTLWRFLTFRDIAFRLQQGKGESLDAAAAKLIDDVVKELPRLRRYLYG